jgi:methylphosphotriester-DNA--protein-cysteine methyltransferase
VGKLVTLSMDPQLPSRDLYDRLLGYIYINGILFNEWIIREGYACTNTRYNYSLKNQLLSAQHDARLHGKGLWPLLTASKPTDHKMRIKPDLGGYTISTGNSQPFTNQNLSAPDTRLNTLSEQTDISPNNDKPFIAYLYSPVYHHKDCKTLKNVPKENRIYFSTREEAESAKYIPCTLCVSKNTKPITKHAKPYDQMIQQHSPSQHNTKNTTDDQKKKFCSTKRSLYYHYCWCDHVKSYNQGFLIYYETEEEALKDGKKPCPKCMPPVP